MNCSRISISRYPSRGASRAPRHAQTSGGSEDGLLVPLSRRCSGLAGAMMVARRPRLSKSRSSAPSTWQRSKPFVAHSSAVQAARHTSIRSSRCLYDLSGGGDGRSSSSAVTTWERRSRRGNASERPAIRSISTSHRAARTTRQPAIDKRPALAAPVPQADQPAGPQAHLQLLSAVPPASRPTSASMHATLRTPSSTPTQSILRSRSAHEIVTPWLIVMVASRPAPTPPILSVQLVSTPSSFVDVHSAELEAALAPESVRSVSRCGSMCSSSTSRRRRARTSRIVRRTASSRSSSQMRRAVLDESWVARATHRITGGPEQ